MSAFLSRWIKGAAGHPAASFVVGRTARACALGAGLLLAAGAQTPAQAQPRPPAPPIPEDALVEGDVARDPVWRTEIAFRAECGRIRLDERDILREDFTGDGVEDVIIRLAASCRGAPGYFCGSRGCRTDLWVDETGVDGAPRYRLATTLMAHEAEVIPWHDGPAVQFDGGPVWAWNGYELDLVGRTGAGGAYAGSRDRGDWRDRDARRDRDWGRDRDWREDDRVWRDPSRDSRGDPDDDRRAWDDRAPPPAPPAPPAPSVEPGVWRLEDGRRGSIQALVTEDRGGGWLSLSCRPGDAVMRLAFQPSSLSRSALSGGPDAQFLVGFDVDGREIQARLMTRSDGGPDLGRGPGDTLAEPAIPFDDPLISALQRGAKLTLRNLGDREILAAFSLKNSRRSLDGLRDSCGY